MYLICEIDFERKFHTENNPTNTFEPIFPEFPSRTLAPGANYKYSETTKIATTCTAT